MEWQICRLLYDVREILTHEGECGFLDEIFFERSENIGLEKKEPEIWGLRFYLETWDWIYPYSNLLQSCISQK